MENTSVICKTDAEILIDFITLKDSGFVFHYAKKEAGVFQQYINCNGKVFGPYEKVMLSVDLDGIARWSVWQGVFIFEYENFIMQVCLFELIRLFFFDIYLFY